MEFDPHELDHLSNRVHSVEVTVVCERTKSEIVVIFFICFHFFPEIHISTTRNSSNMRIGTRFNKRVPASRVPVYSLKLDDRCANRWFLTIFWQNATHCISPYAIVMCVRLSVCVYMPPLWTPEKRCEIETSVKLRGMTTDITCKSLTQIGLQIPIWQTKWRL